MALCDGGSAVEDSAETVTRRRAQERGRVRAIAVGKRADLVVLAKDPMVDIRNTRAIEGVYKGGVLVKRRR